MASNVQYYGTLLIKKYHM